MFSHPFIKRWYHHTASLGHYAHRVDCQRTYFHLPASNLCLKKTFSQLVLLSLINLVSVLDFSCNCVCIIVELLSAFFFFFKWDRSLMCSRINFHLHFGLIQTAAKMNWFLILTHYFMLVERGKSTFWFLFTGIWINLLLLSLQIWIHFPRVLQMTARWCCFAPCSDSAPLPLFLRFLLVKKRIQRNAECWRRKQKLSHWKFLFCTVWSAKTGRLTKNMYLSSVHLVKITYSMCPWVVLPLLPSSFRHLQMSKLSVESEEKKSSALSSYSGYFHIKNLLRTHNAFVGVFNYHKA